MFGMEDKKKAARYIYEIEKELQDPKLRKVIVERCDLRINTLKSELREGADSSIYQQLNLLLQGYMALKKVLNKSIKS